MSLWYVRKDGQTRGPASADQIAREILLGRIRENDDLSTDREHWRPLRSLPQLVPEVMRLAETEAGRQRLLLARLRVDDRGHERRGSGYAPVGSDRRYGDRRNVESFDVVVPRERDIRLAPGVEGERDERNRLLPAAVIMIALFMIATYFFWYRPAMPRAESDCAAGSAPAVNWSGCEMPGRSLSRVDLSRANLSNAKLTGDLQGTQLRAADLSYASLEGADLRGANLRAANLKGVLLSGANLSLSDLRDADLGYANLQAANLNGVSLSGAKLGRAIWTDGRVCSADSVGECH